MTDNAKALGIVIPTILGRPHLLRLAFDSIRNSRMDGRPIHVKIAAETEFMDTLQNMGLGDFAFEIRSKTIVPLSDKLNLTFRSFPAEVEYLSWLGDDDLLGEQSLMNACAILEANEGVAMAYGKCVYINESGQRIFENRAGQWASRIMHFGPNLLPQPGAVWKRSAFVASGGLSSEYKLAIDFDLYFRLKEFGELRYSSDILSFFRWHPSSQSVSKRWVSVIESSKIRRKYLPRVVRPSSVLWEPIIMLATFFTGKLVTWRVRP